MTPTRFGRYEVQRVLGRGGMGVVYEGHDPQIDRPVAIKTIALDALNDEEAAQFEARFRAEMRSTGRLLHQNIVALYDAGRDDGTAYIVMELVPGQDLKRRLAAGQVFGVEQAVDIGLQLLAALDYAHARQVIHRDVKPANLMLQDDGQVKLCDFGVARLTDGDATRTQGAIVGTLRYASPEQIGGGAVDARSDLYSAAALLRELLAGAMPAALETVLQRALSPDPARRFGSANDFAAALRGVGGDTTVALAPPAAATRPHWPWAVAAGVPLLLLGGWLAWPRPALEAAPPGAAPAPPQAASSVAVTEPASRLVPAPKPPPPLKLDGSWIGLYACGETVGPRNPGINHEAFSAKIALDIAGSRISWSRSGKTHGETAIGSIDGRGRFSAEGEGWDDAPERKGRWLVRASGQYNTRVQPARLEGKLELLRSKDNSVIRNCTLSAVPR